MDKPSSWKDKEEKQRPPDIGRGLLVVYPPGDTKPIQFADVTGFQEAETGLLEFEFFEAPRQARLKAKIRVAAWILFEQAPPQKVQ